MKIQDKFIIENTLSLPAEAAKGVVINTVDELQKLVQHPLSKEYDSVALGMGSNIVVRPFVDKLVISIRIGGIRMLKEDSKYYWVRCGAGENWDVLVRRLLDKGMYGLENLVMIPGLVGAAPIQNIGAYGVEVSEFIESIEVVDKNGKKLILDAAQCGFGYRSSIFRNCNEFVVSAVIFKLLKKPNIKIGYPELKENFELKGIKKPTPLEVADEVSRIRTAKLPNPSDHPNAGSFFKNPFVDFKKAKNLQSVHPLLKSYPQEDGVKFSAAQLIDLDGWKGRSKLKVGCWGSQPLVLVNQNQASAKDVLEFADQITQSIKTRYGVSLEIEPSILS